MDVPPLLLGVVGKGTLSVKIWIATIYEPLPFRGIGTRPQRCGMLASELIARGHDVELWTSNFEHIRHVHLCDGSRFVREEEHFGIQFIHGCGYARDRSPKRWIHNRQMASEFGRLATARQERPDLIFAPIPSLELAEATVRFGRENNIPVVVDIRDLWPDVYLHLLPAWARRFARPLLVGEYRRLGATLRSATAISAVSETYLEWGLRHSGRPKTVGDQVFYLGFPKQSSLSSGRGTPLPQAEMAARFGIQEGEFVATFVGSFSHFLDVPTILRAARLLIEEKTVRFIVAGTGDNLDDLTRRASDLPNVEMPGWLELDSVLAALKLSNLGLAAYSKNALMSLPNKPFEYMAAGLPLLSSLRGEMERIIEDNNIGRTYEGGNERSLAEHVKWFADHRKEAKEMGSRALGLFERTFSSDHIYSEMAKHLEGLVRSAKV
jgi:glycosyltransferase involved in cell wall biosynthesis